MAARLMTCNLTISSSAVKDLAIFLRTSGAILGTCSQYSPMSHRMLARAMGTCGCGGIRTGVNVARGWARCLPGNWPTALRGSLETGIGGGEREIKRRAFPGWHLPPSPEFWLLQTQSQSWLKRLTSWICCTLNALLLLFLNLQECLV